MLLNNDEFLIQVKELFNSTQQKGTVFLTQKRYTYDDGAGDANMADAAASSSSDLLKTYPCIIRATNGKKVKISTLVQPGDLSTFHVGYSAVLKGSLTSLRPKRAKAKKGAQGTAGGKKRKGGVSAGAGGTGGRFTLPKVVGPRRGAGVEKRRRLMRRRMLAVKKMRRREAARSGKTV